MTIARTKPASKKTGSAVTACLATPGVNQLQSFRQLMMERASAQQTLARAPLAGEHLYKFGRGRGWAVLMSYSLEVGRRLQRQRQQRRLRRLRQLRRLWWSWRLRRLRLPWLTGLQWLP